MSPKASFVAGHAIRGGIPLCFPWFAKHADHPEWPSHGLARTRIWTLLSREDAVARFGLQDDAATRTIWPYAFRFETTVRLDERLHLTFTYTNLHNEPVPVMGALHTYLRFPSLDVQIEGLEECSGFDKLAGARFGPHSVEVKGPIDKIFEDAPATLIARHPTSAIQIHNDAADAVIWNPGAEGARSIADLGEGEHDNFVCVEAAQTRPVLVGPGETFQISTTLSIDA